MGTESEGVDTSMSYINDAVESVMDLINALKPFSPITRGAMSTGASLVCEVAPSRPEAVYMDKHQYIPLDLTINGKHTNLKTLSDTLNDIHDYLTTMTDYPSGDGWQIVDISTYTEPQVIGREQNSEWLMASDLNIKIKSEEKTQNEG